MQNKIFSVNKTLNLKGKIMDLSLPKVMGILNATPDSFYAGSRGGEAKLLSQAEKMIEEGADFLDVGGYSSRPGATDISVEEELGRVIPAISAIKKQFPDAPVSIDTFRAEVAQKAVDAGADLVNDISGGELDSRMIPVVARAKVPYICMHMRGTPQTMTQWTDYDNLVPDIINFFHSKILALAKEGIHDIIIDPGLGFAKTVEQNFELLNKLDQFMILGKAVMVGISRKSMIWKTLKSDPENALNGTTALHAVALLKGASILRVHDVKEGVEVVKLLRFVS